MNWTESKIRSLKAMLAKIGGRLWTGTSLSGYAEQGPYSCGDCVYLNDLSRDGYKGRAPYRCEHPVVKADPQMHRDGGGWPIVDARHGCCEFVEPPK